MSMRSSKTDAILDLLLDLLQERQAARQADPHPNPLPEGEGMALATPTLEGERMPLATPIAEGEASDEPAPPPAPRGDVRQALGRLMALVGLLVLAANIPLTTSGLSLARLVPSDRSIVIRDGLILKGSGPEFHVLQDGKLRWISSLDAFQHYGYRWSQVHQVDDAFLAQFERSAPLDVLLKCPQSVHIYRLENDRKRWIKDIATFEAEGHQWSDVKMVDCATLRSLPDGPPIPEDAGPPPQP